MESIQSKPVQVNGVDMVCFLDLPPELRNAVYELCLVYTGTDDVVAAIIRPGLAKIGARRWAWVKHGLQPTLLVACRQIYQEAMPVLYGNSVFEVQKIASGRLYLEFGTVKASERRREAVKHIRHVELSRYKNQSEYFKLLQELLLMPKLRKVQVRPHFRLNFRSTDSMSAAVLPLLEKLNTLPENKSGSRSISHITFKAYNWPGEYYSTPAFVRQLSDVLLRALAETSFSGVNMGLETASSRNDKAEEGLQDRVEDR